MADRLAVKSFREILSLVETEIGSRTYEIWFREVLLKNLYRGTLTIGVPNLFFRDFIDERYGRMIGRAANRVLGTAIKVEVKVDPELYRKHRENISAEEVMDVLDATPAVDKDADLDSFFVVPENEFAWRAIRHAVQRQEPTFNPIFLAAPSGLGKTHLVRCFRTQAQLDGEDAPKVLVTDALQFTSHFTMALKMKTVDQFRSFYDGFGVIVVDEVHRFRGKKATQVEFVARLKEWLESGKQVAMASRHRPQEIENVSQPFQSQLHAGLVVEIRPYSHSSLVKIMSQGLGPDRKPLREDVLKALVADCHGSLGLLKRCILRIHAYAALLREPVTPEFIAKHRGDLFGASRGSEYESIIKASAEHFGVTRSALLSKRKVKSLRLPRGVVVCVLRDQHQLTFKEIGRILGDRSHTSIHLIYNRYRGEIQSDAALCDLMTRLANRRTGSSPFGDS
ncbi:MAG: DnaA/Hda family protein [Planctomycetota bacterium]